MVEKIFSVMDKITGFCLFMISSLMIAAGITQVCCRYVLRVSVPWTEEMMRYLYVWLVMIGIGLALRRNAYISIEFLYVALKRKMRRVAVGIFCLIVLSQLVFFALLTYWGFVYSNTGMTSFSPIMRLQMGKLYLALPLGGIIGIIYTLNTIVETVRKEGF
jgi:TRAP-type C4-dicarboxylate transport system permease small subunit